MRGPSPNGLLNCRYEVESYGGPSPLKVAQLLAQGPCRTLRMACRRPTKREMCVKLSRQRWFVASVTGSSYSDLVSVLRRGRGFVN